jgi:hypothetical protein
VLVVTKLDRLARSTLDLLRIIDRIGKEGAGFKSLGSVGRHHDPARPPDADGARRQRRLCGALHKAEFERDLILQRTSEGRARAMAEGTRFGRRPKLTEHQAREACGSGRDPARDRAELQRRSLDDLQAQGTVRCRGLTVPPWVRAPGVDFFGPGRGSSSSHTIWSNPSDSHGYVIKRQPIKQYYCGMAAEYEPTICEFCKQGRVIKRMEEMAFPRVTVLVGTCDNCGLKSLDPDELEDEAV